MERSIFKTTILSFFVCIFTIPTNAQFLTHYQQIKSQWTEVASTSKYFDNGDFVSCGYVGANALFQDTLVATTFTGGTTNATIPYLAKYNVNGRVEWVITPSQVNGGYGIINDLSILSNGDIIAIGQYVNSFAFGTSVLPNAGGSGFVIKVDSTGNIIWVKNFSSQIVTPYKCAKQNDNSIIIAGQYQNSLSLGNVSLNDLGPNLFVCKIDSSGNWQGLIGSTTPSTNFGVFIHSMQANSQGDVYLAGEFYGGNFGFGGGTIQHPSNGGTYQSLLFKFNFDNQALEWSSFFPCINCSSNSLDHIVIDPTTNNVFVAGRFQNTFTIGSTSYVSAGNIDGILFSMNTNGNVNWVRKISGSNYDLINGLSIIDTSKIAILGSFSSSIVIGANTINLGDNATDAILKFSANGTFIEAQPFDADFDNYIEPSSLDYCEKINSFLITSYLDQPVNLFVWNFIPQGLKDIIIYSLWNGVCNQENNVNGYVFVDSNNNCIKDSNEQPLKNSLVTCLPGPRYALTDSLGYFEICVDTGSYTIISKPLSEQWTSTCQDTIQIQSNYNNNNPIYFGYDPGSLCPKLKVEVSSLGVFRRCQPVKYIIEATNDGTSVQNSAYLKLSFPNSVSYSSSNISNVNIVGNDVYLNLGDVYPGQIIRVDVDALVSCFASLGSTQCLEARFLPDTPCSSVDSAYDRRNITLFGECLQNDSARFVVKNINTANQFVYQGYTKMYLNNALLRTDTFSLAQNDSITLVQDVNNATIRCELHFFVNQMPAYNGTQVTLSDCDNSSGIGSNGINFLPQFDNDLNFEIICNNIVGSYDPNDKTASPIGITNNHYLPQNELIEYQINFQNVGNDTAFNVLIVDTLSSNLDLTTLQLGPSSHSYYFNITDGNILNWYFPQILLPDSTTNFIESCGQVNFKIRTLNSLPPNTQIFNSAAIYFDFNDPVITNSVFHTILDTTLVISSLEESFEKFGISVFPNPVSERLNIQFSDPSKNVGLRFRITDLLGKTLVYEQNVHSNLSIDVKSLSPGFYILILENDFNKYSIRFIKE